eukprot:6196870-Pleurochrysis_carterae.AAC.2
MDRDSCRGGTRDICDRVDGLFAPKPPRTANGPSAPAAISRKPPPRARSYRSACNQPKPNNRQSSMQQRLFSIRDGLRHKELFNCT